MAKHVPNRMCVACRKMQPKKELMRIVSSEEGLKIDLKGKAPGRGAYVCKNRECVDKAFKELRFARSFKRGISQTEYAELSAQVDALFEEEAKAIAKESEEPVTKTVTLADGREQIIRVVRKGKTK